VQPDWKARRARFAAFPFVEQPSHSQPGARRPVHTGKPNVARRNLLPAWFIRPSANS